MKISSASPLLLAALVATTTLTGCPAVLLTGAAGGMMSAADRRTTGTQLDDQAIELRAHDRLRKELPDKSDYISVASYNRRALMYGQVTDESIRLRAEEIVSGTSGIREVVDEVTVSTAATFGNHANDTLVANKVRASLINAKGVPFGTINVTSEKGTVYLQGLVSEIEGERAAKVAAAVDGVNRVVKVFETPTQADIDRINRINSSTPPTNGRPE